MKKSLFKQHQLIVLLCLIVIVCLLSGCIAELGLEAEVAGELAEAEAAGEIVGAEAAGADIASAEVMAEADEVALLRNGLAENSAGEMTIANTESMNTLLGRVRLARAYGESPKLYFEGKPNAFAEVYPENGKFRMLSSNKYYSIPENIFSVEGESVRIRSGAEISSNNILTTVKHGELVVKLAEKDGWYQIKCVRNSKVYFGWIKATYALPLVLLAVKEKKEKNLITYSKYPNENEIKADLIGKNIPGWRFDYLSEFQKIQIKNEKIENGNLIQTVDLRLKDANNSDIINSEIEIKYNNTNTGWKISDVTRNSFSKVSSNNQTNPYINNGRQKVSYANVRRYLHGNYIFNSNVIISSKISGRFTIEKNVSCIVGLNGLILGDLVLNEDAILTVDGVISGTVYNYGGKIINHNPRCSVRVINYRSSEIRTAPSAQFNSPYVNRNNPRRNLYYRQRY